MKECIKLGQSNSYNGTLKAPFPYFGGKSRVAGEVWKRFGGVRNYVEPFFGSGAVLLARPGGAGAVETVNDVDGFVCNFWRAVAWGKEELVKWVDWPVIENDLHARHGWLVNQREALTARLEGDPGYFDARIAGWWCWGACCWIGGGWCEGVGPWRAVEGRLVNMSKQGGNGGGVERKRPLLGHSGRGVHRKLPHLGDGGKGIRKQLVHLGNHGVGIHRSRMPLLNENGVHRRRVMLGGHGSGVGIHSNKVLVEWFDALCERLRGVRVCCGDFERVLGPSVTTEHGLTGVFLDPPYGLGTGRDEGLYGREDYAVAVRAAEWARAYGEDPKLRIALCGYVGEHDMPGGWECFRWSTRGGYSNQRKRTRGDVNRNKECIWFSPGCLKAELF